MVLIQSYRYNTENFTLFCCKIRRNGHWRCSVKEAVHKKTSPILKENTCVGVFIKKRLQHRCFPVKIAKFLRTSILKNICDRLLLKISSLQKKLYIDFFHKIMTFIIITIIFEALKFLLSFCAVFANLFYKNIRSSLLC